MRGRGARRRLRCRAGLAAPTGPLSQKGRWITDAHGRVAIMHGVNMVSKRPPYAPVTTGFGLDDARFLRREGFDTVRLGLIYAGVEPAPGRHSQAYLDQIERTARCPVRGGHLLPAGLPPGPLQRALRGRGLARLGGAGRRPAGRAQDGLPEQLPGHARAQPRVRPLLGQRPGPRRRGTAGPLRRGLAAGGHALPRPPVQHGLRPAERALARHRLAGVRQPGGLPGVRPRQADAVLAARVPPDPARRPARHRLVRAQRAVQQRPEEPPRGGRAPDRA